MDFQTGTTTHPADLVVEPGKRARVAVWAADQITMNGLAQTLMGSLEVFLATDDLPEAVDVLVYAVDRVNSTAIAALRRMVSWTAAPVVLVATEFDRAHLLSAVECRVVAVLHRSTTTGERLVNAVDLAVRGGGALPPDLLGNLLRQLQGLQREGLMPLGPKSVSLSQREIDVVRLLADGWGTEEIANELRYSERTVKNVIHALLGRLGVRNRPHLVAFGARAGIL